MNLRRVKSFSATRKTKLDRPDGLKHQWYDLQKGFEIFSKRVQGKEFVLVQGAI